MKQKTRINDAGIIAGLWPTLKAVPTIARWAEVQIRYPFSKNVMTRIMCCTLSCTQRQKEVDGSVIGYGKNSRILCVKVFNEIHSARLRVLFPPPPSFLPSLSQFLFVSFARMFYTAVFCNAAVADSKYPRLFGVSQRRNARMRLLIRHVCLYFHSCVRPHVTYNTKTDESLSKSVNIFQISLKSGNNANTLREYLREFMCASRK